jgi:hypothetical protein
MPLHEIRHWLPMLIEPSTCPILQGVFTANAACSVHVDQVRAQHSLPMAFWFVLVYSEVFRSNDSLEGPSKDRVAR